MQMWDIFTDEYLPNPQKPWGRFALVKHELVSEVDGDTVVRATILDNGEPVELTGHGNGPIAAFCEALHDHADVRVLDYHEHALASGGDAEGRRVPRVRGRRPGPVGCGHPLLDRHRVAEGRRERGEPGPTGLIGPRRQVTGGNVAGTAYRGVVKRAFVAIAVALALGDDPRRRRRRIVSAR
jgi:hypothetical protein